MKRQSQKPSEPLLRLGCVANIGSIVTIHPKLLNRRGYHWGDYLEIHHPEQDTMVIRQLLPIECKEKIRVDSVYVDPTAMHLLCADMTDKVRVTVSDHGMSFP